MPTGASWPTAPEAAHKGSNGPCPSSSEPGEVASGAPHASNPNSPFHRDEQRIR